MIEDPDAGKPHIWRGNRNFHPDFMLEVGVSKEILDANIFISLPKFKTHGLTVMTGAIKNSYGILPPRYMSSRVLKTSASSWWILIIITRMKNICPCYMWG